MQTTATDDRTRRTFVVLAVLVGLLAVGGGMRACAARTPANLSGSTQLASLQPTDIHPGLDYSLDQVAATGTAPRLFISKLSHDLNRIQDVDQRKRTFFRILLPIVARENQRILKERKKIEADPSHVPQKLYDEYNVDSGDVKTLLRRVDVVPVSLVLAQAAVESGWGSSRFARKGNNLFGMHSTDDGREGIQAKQADGVTVAAYPSLAASVHAYMLNLNTHPAYAKLRRARADMRRNGEKPRGTALTGLLSNYSEVPERYGRMLRKMIEDNRLARFDGVKLNS